jgi:hypothetical protein
MAKKYNLEITAREMEALLDMVSTIESEIGGSAEANETAEGVGSFDVIQTKNLRIFDKMLKRNGYKR